MDKYLIEYQPQSGKRKGRIIELSTRDTSADEFGEIQRAFAKEAGATKNDWPGFADMWRLYEDQKTAAGVYYDYALVSSQGAGFTLFKTPDITPEQIAASKKEIRDDHDVVGLQVLTVILI